MAVVLFYFVMLLSYALVGSALPPARRLALRDEVAGMFTRSWDFYFSQAYPLDELNPILCAGRGPDRSNPANINVNDVLGDYSLTLIDALDTLVVFGNVTEFHQASKLLMQRKSFDIDSLVSVFEVTIRVLGGLLTAHVLTTDEIFRSFWIPDYSNEFLKLAHDLGRRLLPAFENTRTGLPFPRVNLRRGVMPFVINETCTAGAGTLLLEFGMLSRLTGDARFETVAKRALLALWERRSNLDLIGNVIDIQTGKWLHQESGVSAGMDSFFEYLFKAYVLLGDAQYLEIFQEAYAALEAYVRDSTGYIYRNVHMDTGVQYFSWIDSLGAYLPGLQVLIGDIEAAERVHEIYFAIWRKFDALPERFDFQRHLVTVSHYPLRPEIAESTYLLYRATRDPYYLSVGEVLVRDLQRHTSVRCGYATLHSVLDKSHEDRMESFFLSETLKYLYLLFDEDNLYNQLDGNYVFSTEGHLMHAPHRRPGALTLPRAASSNHARLTCPPAPKLSLAASWSTHGSLGLRSQHHVGIRQFVGWSDGVPIPLYQQQQVNTVEEQSAAPPPVVAPPERKPRKCTSNINPTPPPPGGETATLVFRDANGVTLVINGHYHGLKMYTKEHGLELQLKPMIQSMETNISNQRWVEQHDLSISTRNPSETPLTDPRAWMCPAPTRVEHGLSYGVLSINKLRISPEFIVPTLQAVMSGNFIAAPVVIRLLEKRTPDTDEDSEILLVRGLVAAFTPAPCEHANGAIQGTLWFSPSTFTACGSFQDPTMLDAIVMVDRGDCRFFDKVRNVQAAGARAIIVANYDDTVFLMSGVDAAGHLEPVNEDLIPAILIGLSVANKLKQAADEHSTREVSLS